MKKFIRKYYLTLFKILLLIAGIISILEIMIINLILVIITFLLLYSNKILKINKKVDFPNTLEILILILIYISIYFESISLLSSPKILIKIVFHSILSIIIALLAFSIIYILNKEKKLLINLNPKFVSIFAFCFSIAIGTIWQIFRHIMNYFFNINIQNYYASDALGFLAIHTLEAGIISFLGYLFLISEDKYSIKKTIFKKLGISKEESNKDKLKNLKNIINKGESDKLELKETLRYNIHTKQYDKKIELSSLKTITAFLNSTGGILLIGISDNNEIKGLERDNFNNEDKCLLHLTNLIKKHIGSEFSPLINYKSLKIDNSYIIKIECKKSDREVFLKEENEERFYIRTGPSSQELKGSKLIKYIKRRFRKFSIRISGIK